MLLGCDTSNWQGPINGDLLSLAAQFWAMKASEGTTYADPYLPPNWQQAKLHGIPRIAYHFARPSLATGKQEAEWFVACVAKAGGAQKGDVIVLDSEDMNVASDADLRAHHLDFGNTVRSYGWNTPILYSRNDYVKAHKLNDLFLKDWGYWVASWDTSAEPVLPDGCSFWALWQYGQGQLPGVNGYVDLDLFNGTVDQLRKYGRVA